MNGEEKERWGGGGEGGGVGGNEPKWRTDIVPLT